MKKFLSKVKGQKLQQCVLAGILLLASIIRFTGLVRRDFWYDEAFTGVAVKENFHSMILMIINDVHPPLYYLTLKVFASIFNYSVFGIRLFSAIFGVLCVLAIYLVTKELFSKQAAAISSFLVAISPFAVQYSQEARMYSMLVFLILISVYFFIKGLRTNQRKYFIYWGIFMGLSMLTHYMGIIFSVTYVAAYLVWHYFENESVLHKIAIKAKVFVYGKKVLPAKNILLGYFLAILIFSPWINNFKHHLIDVKGNLTWVKPASFGNIITTGEMFLFGTPLGEMSSGMPQPNEIGMKYQGTMHLISHISIDMVLAVLMGATLVWIVRYEKKQKIYLLLIFSVGFMFLVYLLSLISTPEDPKEYFVARYLLPGAYFFYIYIGVVLSHVKVSTKVAAFAVYFTMLAFIIPLSNSTGYNKLILNLGKYKNNDFYILNSFDYVITKYYLGADRLTLYNYDWPQYNPSYWAAIGPSLKRTENYEDLRNDPNALIISNKVLNRDNQYFSTQGLTLVDQYDNILIYKFQH